ncbi:MAG: hypothetical protein ACI350_04425 [Prevotella sp.]
MKRKYTCPMSYVNIVLTESLLAGVSKWKSEGSGSPDMDTVTDVPSDPKLSKDNNMWNDSDSSNLWE